MVRVKAKVQGMNYFLAIQFYMVRSMLIFAPKFKHGRFLFANGKKY